MSVLGAILGKRTWLGAGAILLRRQVAALWGRC